MAFAPIRPLQWHLFRLALLGLIPLAVFAALALFNAGRAHRAELSRSTVGLARAVASAVHAELEGTVVALASLSRSPDLQAGDIRAFYERARQLTELQPEWTAITLADASGKVLFRTSLPIGAEPLAPVEGQSLSEALRLGQPVVGPAARGPRGQVTAAVRYPVMRDGRVDYVLTAVVTAERLASMLERQRVPKGWVIAILDPSLRIFARSTSQAQFALRPATPGLQALVRSQEQEGSGVSPNQEGRRVVTGFSRTPGFDWVVAVGAPLTPLASFFSPTLALYVAGAVGSLVICAWLAIRAARRISLDIARVAETAVALGQGTPVSVFPSRIREIDRLGLALNEAGERLNEAHAAQAAALEQAQEAGRAKDEFLAVLGHELRNPLAPMVSAMYLLDSGSPSAAERARTVLHRQLAHMRRLVDDLLDVARITRGKIDVQPEPMELVQELRTVLEDVRQTHPDAAGATIEFHPGVAEAWVMGDPRRLAQVFINVLANALRHGAGKPVTVRLDMRDEQVRVSIEDRGDGMDQRTLARVFEPFYQSGLHPQDPEGGPDPGRSIGSQVRGSLGLGLAIVKSIVQAHGGSVAAHSAGPNQGSCFEIVLPALPTVRRTQADAARA